MPIFLGSKLLLSTIQTLKYTSYIQPSNCSFWAFKPVNTGQSVAVCSIQIWYWEVCLEHLLGHHLGHFWYIIWSHVCGATCISDAGFCGRLCQYLLWHLLHHLWCISSGVSPLVYLLWCITSCELTSMMHQWFIHHHHICNPWVISFSKI